MSWLDSIKQLLLSIKEILPAIAAFLLGRESANKEKAELEVKLEGAQLELEKKKNKEVIEKLNKGLDNRSILQRAIAKGRDLLKKDKNDLL